MIVLYAIVLILGFATSYTDIKFKKIRNNHLLLATAFGLVAYTYLIATHQITPNINLIWNLLLGLGIGLLLYFMGTWGAGDAKLFAVFCLLMPTEKYSQILFSPSIAIFVNIFVVSTFAIAIFATKEIISDRTVLSKKFLTLSILIKFTKSFLIVFSLKGIIQAAVTFFIPQAKPFISIFILFFAYLAVSHIMGTIKNNLVLVIILLLGLISGLLIYPPSTHFSDLFPHLKRILFYTCIFNGIRIIFKIDEECKNTAPIPFAPLMLVGTLLTNTDFLNWFMHILRAAKR